MSGLGQAGSQSPDDPANGPERAGALEPQVLPVPYSRPGLPKDHVEHRLAPPPHVHRNPAFRLRPDLDRANAGWVPVPRTRSCARARACAGTGAQAASQHPDENPGGLPRRDCLQLELFTAPVSELGQIVLHASRDGPEPGVEHDGSQHFTVSRGRVEQRPQPRRPGGALSKGLELLHGLHRGHATLTGQEIVEERVGRVGKPPLHQAGESPEVDHGEEVVDDRRPPPSEQPLLELPIALHELVQLEGGQAVGGEGGESRSHQSVKAPDLCAEGDVDQSEATKRDDRAERRLEAGNGRAAGRFERAIVYTQHAIQELPIEGVRWQQAENTVPVEEVVVEPPPDVTQHGGEQGPVGLEQRSWHSHGPSELSVHALVGAKGEAERHGTGHPTVALDEVAVLPQTGRRSGSWGRLGRGLLRCQVAAGEGGGDRARLERDEGASPSIAFSRWHKSPLQVLRRAQGVRQAAGFTGHIESLLVT